MESDADYRQRIPAAFEGMSVAGPVGAYEYHALSSDGRVADASAFSPSPAEVVVTILARDGDGTAPEDLLQVVGEALNDEAVRPVADRVSVRSAEIVPYEIDAVLYVYPGPAKEPILGGSESAGHGIHQRAASPRGVMCGCPRSMPRCMFRVSSASN